MASIRLGSSSRAFSAGGAEAPKSTSSVPRAVSSQKQVLQRPPEPNASPDPTIVSFISPGPCTLARERVEYVARAPERYAFVLGLADTSACQRFKFVSSSGAAIRAGFMKSTAQSAVISATVKRSPATNGFLPSSASRVGKKSTTRGRFASAQAGTCGTSSSFIAGCVCLNTCATGKKRDSSQRLFHISTTATSFAPTPNRGGSGCSTSK